MAPAGHLSQLLAAGCPRCGRARCCWVEVAADGLVHPLAVGRGCWPAELPSGCRLRLLPGEYRRCRAAAAAAVRGLAGCRAAASRRAPLLAGGGPRRRPPAAADRRGLSLAVAACCSTVGAFAVAQRQLLLGGGAHVRAGAPTRRLARLLPAGVRAGGRAPLLSWKGLRCRAAAASVERRWLLGGVGTCRQASPGAGWRA